MTWLARRSDLFGINRRNVELVYPNNARRDYPLADDKLRTKERLAAAQVPMAETLVVCQGLFAIPGALDLLAQEERFVVKPASGSGGAGIVILGERLRPGVWRRAGGGEQTLPALQRHLADIVFGAYSHDLEDRAFVERRIEPHDLFRELWADGLCDIRLLTLKHRPLWAMVRVPTARSGGRANLHQGGLGLAVDLDQGRTTRAVFQGEPVAQHPETGRALLGLVLPHWPLVLEVARRAAEAVPLGYLGVDIAVDRERGPLVLEINVRPGLEIQNVHGRGLGTALRGGP